MQKCEEIREDSQKKTSGNENRFKCPLLQQSYESPCWERGFLRQLICITSRANEPPKGHAKRRNVLHLTMTSLLLSLKLTASTWKWMVRIMLVSLWGKKPIFRGEAVSFRYLFCTGSSLQPVLDVMVLFLLKFLESNKNISNPKNGSGWAQMIFLFSITWLLGSSRYLPWN